VRRHFREQKKVKINCRYSAATEEPGGGKRENQNPGDIADDPEGFAPREVTTCKSAMDFVGMIYFDVKSQTS